MTVNDIEKNQRGATDSTHPTVSAAYPSCIYLYTYVYICEAPPPTYVYKYTYTSHVIINTSTDKCKSYGIIYT